MPKKLLLPKAVIFDMDGVITDTMPYHYKAWVAAMKPSQTPVKKHDVYIREGQPGINFVWDMSQEYAKNFSKREAKKILDHKETAFKKMVKVRFFKGVRPFIRGLHKQKIALGLVTGTSRHELDRMLPGSFKRLFDVIVTGSDVKRGKPHPDSFSKAVRELNVPKSQVLVIENAPFGIAASKKAGLRCVALQSYLPKSDLKEADFIFPDIFALQRNLK